jgi:hypothetical protein
MKPMTKIAIGAAAVLVVAATMQPAQAACAGPRLLDTLAAYIVTNPAWGGAGGTGTCAYGGCYASESAAPVSENLSGVFWAFDVLGDGSGGDPAIPAGNDNGAWGSENWTMVNINVGPFPNGYYHYPAWLTTQNPETNGGAGNPFGWDSTALIDGCVGNVTPGTDFDECSCLLLTDEWEGQGYFAILSAKSTGNGNFFFFDTIGETVQLAPIPAPSVTMAERNADTGDVTFMIDVPPVPAAGDYRDPECGCNFGFRVYSQIVGRDGMPPATRRACTPQDYVNDSTYIPGDVTSIQAICEANGLNWVEAAAPTGGQQPITSLSAGRATANVTVSCDPGLEQDLYLATALMAEEGPGGIGLGGGNVSTSSFRVECGANYAEPNRPDRGRSGDAPRGRDENRGRGQQRDR